MKDSSEITQKFIVFKMEDLEAVCSSEDVTTIMKVSDAIAEHRKETERDPYPSYLVVNEDEPYADQVLKMIQEHEEGEE
ncbi:TPA: hypothetical protein QCY29_005267 [Bacillus toyonensis]|nr:hypothetical protein [Bacillus toyonensis]